ncbi:MAG: DNA translocase FtsK [Lachnospiraceae bacterium]|nr:DNA translocase FtsK [Lachnospiraceae bacterium]
MANTKKTTGKTKTKKSPAKKPAEKKTERPLVTEPTKENNPLYKEAALWVVLAVCIVLFVSNFGVGGKVGNFISSLLFGLSGIVSYVLPVLIFLGTLFGISNAKNKTAVIKIVAAVLFVCFLCLFFELIFGADSYGPIAAFVHSFREHTGGGIIGGLFAWIFAENFGLLCAYIVDIIMIVVTLVLLTGRSAINPLKKGSKSAYESAKSANERVKEFRENTKARRLEQKAVGVPTDTLLTPETPASSDDMTEITPKLYEDISASLEKRVEEELLKSEINLTDLNKTETEFKPAEQSISKVETIKLTPLTDNPMEDELFEEGVKTAAAVEASKLMAQEMPVFSPELMELFEKSDNAEIGAASPEGKTVAKFEDTLPDEDALVSEAFKGEPFAEDNPFDDVPPAQSRVTKVEPVKSEAPKKSVMLDNTPEDVSGLIEDNLNAAPKKEYVFPPVSLLSAGNPNNKGDSTAHLQQTALKLQQTLKNFGVNVTVSDVSCGPTVTRYEIQPEMGVKVSKIVNLTDDIKLNLAAADIRMEAPIPGKAAIGIEIPNKTTVPVMFRDLVESKEFKDTRSLIAFGAGKDIAGNVIMADIAKMPHLLIAGATGSGKSVCINTIIMSILYRAKPDNVKLIMIDPKVVELSVYNGIPHLLIPVVTDPKKAAGALNWAVAEMMERYDKFAKAGVRDMAGYNAKCDSLDVPEDQKPQKMPQIVIIVDELADLMMVAPGDVEDAICRLAQLARAAGIHLIIATQRPSVNVITGLIKANMPSRIAFAVTSGIDSRTILDMVGAEKLLGKGDMLYYPQGLPKPIRLQGAFVTDKEVQAVVDFITENYGEVSYDKSTEEKMASMSESTSSKAVSAAPANDRDAQDEYFEEAGRVIIDKDKASIGMLQRYFKIGFNRAARIMDQLEDAGVVGPEEGTKPRQILMSIDQYNDMIDGIEY